MNIYQIITDKVITQLEQGIIPWHKPWGGVATGAINYVSRKPYSLLNQILLGDRQGEWLTFNQIKNLGGSIKKGAKSSFVVFWSQVPITKTNEDGDEICVGTRPILRYYNVFHVNDTTGIPSKIVASEEPKHNPINKAEVMIYDYVDRESTLKFINDKPSDKACYSPAFDMVQVPMMEQFQEIGEYYSTAFHELTHSTMIKGRCDRKSDSSFHAFGSKEYSKEELVAEMGAAMLCSIAGIEAESVFKNSVAYLQGWLKAFKQDNKMIVYAASQAEKAVKYIINDNEE